MQPNNNAITHNTGAHTLRNSSSSSAPPPSSLWRHWWPTAAARHVRAHRLRVGEGGAAQRPERRPAILRTVDRWQHNAVAVPRRRAGRAAPSSAPPPEVGRRPERVVVVVVVIIATDR